MPTLVGSNKADKLAGKGSDAYTLKGLGGDDTYTVRLFTKTIYHQYGDPSEEVYVRDTIVEAAKGGYDTVRLYNYFSPYEFTGITPVGSMSASQLSGVEHIIATSTVRSGKAIGWTISAGGENNLIEAPGSNDTLSGGGGTDTIKGGGGDDKLLGDEGDDRLFGGTGNDTLIGASGKDLLDGGTGSDTISFTLDRVSNTVDLSTGRNSSGAQLRSIENAVGGSRIDKLIGSAGDNTLFGMDGDDTLSGGKGGDWLLGGKGNDTLSGGDGGDRLDSGGGIDTLTGGAGVDRFEFTFATEQVTVGEVLKYAYRHRVSGYKDTITDFQDGIDKIVLDGVFSISNLQLANKDVDFPGRTVTWSQVGDDTKINFGDPTRSATEIREADVYFGSVTLKQFDAETLSRADFLFV